MKPNKRNHQTSKHKRKTFRRILKWIFRICKLSILFSLFLITSQILAFLFNLNFPWLNIPLPFELPLKHKIENTPFPETQNSDKIEFQPEQVSLIVITTVAPSVAQQKTPNVKPIITPTFVPTTKPTATPTVVPTIIPTVTPTSVPTIVPTVITTSVPTTKPTATPVIILNTTPTQHSILKNSTFLIPSNYQIDSFPTVSIQPNFTPKPIATNQPLENYTTIITFQLSTALIDTLLSENRYTIPQKDIYLSYEDNTLFFSSDTSLIEVEFTPTILNYLKDSKIENINMQNFITLNLFKIISCVEDYDVTNVIFSWKKGRIDEPYQYGLVFEQSILSLLLNGKCNFDLTNYNWRIKNRTEFSVLFFIQAFKLPS